MRALVFSLVAAVACTSVASAATITVKNGQSIQAAIDIAVPGDVIKVAAGEYSENLLVPAGLDGLTIQGNGKKKAGIVVDARVVADGSGPGLRIQSDGVTVKNMTFRHARADLTLSGHGVEVTANGVTLSGVNVFRSQVDGVNVTGDGFTATGCDISGNGANGFTIAGNGATIQKTRVYQHKDSGIVVVGTGTTIVDVDVVIAKEGQGISVTGADTTVQKTTVCGSFLESMDVNGANAIVEKCTVENGGEDGIKVNGTNLLVTKNVVRGLLGAGDGLRISNATSGVVSKNQVSGTAEAGIKISGSSGVVISDNLFSDCGSDKRPALNVQSSCSMITVSHNTVLHSQGDGIRLDGNGHLVTDNTVKDSLEDGIDLASGVGTEVRSNNVTESASEGFENNGTDTIVVDNVFKKNRLDYANDGTIATDSGNKFDTGGPTTPPEIDN